MANDINSKRKNKKGFLKTTPVRESRFLTRSPGNRSLPATESRFLRRAPGTRLKTYPKITLARPHAVKVVLQAIDEARRRFGGFGKGGFSKKVIIQAMDEARRRFGGFGKGGFSKKVIIQAMDEARRRFGEKEFIKRHWFIDSIASVFKNSMGMEKRVSERTMV